MSVPFVKAVDQGHQLVPLLLNRAGESELHQSPIQIVAGSLRFEITVACKVISEKSQTQFQGDQADARRQVAHIVVTERKDCPTVRYPSRIERQSARSNTTFSGAVVSSPRRLQQERRQSPMS